VVKKYGTLLDTLVIEIEAVEAVAVEAIIIAIKASWVLVNSSGNK
jgi:hypothetical protein